MPGITACLADCWSTVFNFLWQIPHNRGQREYVMIKDMLIQSPCPLSVMPAWFPLKVFAVNRVIVARRQWLLPFPDSFLARWLTEFSRRRFLPALHFQGLRRSQPRGMQRWSLRPPSCATSGHLAHYITWRVRLSTSARCHWQPLTMKLC